jgi:AI-2 transport protein TqsA
MPNDLRREQTWVVVGSHMILATVALGAALMYTRQVMIPFVLALFISTMVSPIVDCLRQKLRFPHFLAVSGAFLVVLGLFLILALFLVYAVQTMLTANASEQYVESFVKLAENFLKRLEGWGVHLREKEVMEEIQSQVPGILSSTVGTATEYLSSLVLILIFVVFLLAGRREGAVRHPVHRDIESAVRNYLTTKIVISAITGILVWLILWMFALPMASLFGILAFLLNFIPSIGSIISTMLPIPIAFAEYNSIWMILAVVALPGSVHMFIGNIVEPKVMGQGLTLHPVTILLALAFWGLLWGPIGMVLSVPIVASIRIVFLRFATTKPLGDLLAGRLPGEGEKGASRGLYT